MNLFEDHEWYLQLIQDFYLDNLTPKQLITDEFHWEDLLYFLVLGGFGAYLIYFLFFDNPATDSLMIFAQNLVGIFIPTFVILGLLLVRQNTRYQNILQKRYGIVSEGWHWPTPNFKNLQLQKLEPFLEKEGLLDGEILGQLIMALREKYRAIPSFWAIIKTTLFIILPILSIFLSVFWSMMVSGLIKANLVNELIKSSFLVSLILFEVIALSVGLATFAWQYFESQKKRLSSLIKLLELAFVRNKIIEEL